MKFLFPEGKLKALTFSYDDGTDFDRRLIATLNEYGLKGSFHLNSSATHRSGILQSPEKASSVYFGHEIAGHGLDHRNLQQLTSEQMQIEIGCDRRALEIVSGKLVQGFSYAYGAYNEAAMQILRNNGFLYARTTQSTGNFWLPTDFLAWHPTCHHNDMLSLGKQFIGNLRLEMQIMLVWGHSYEFGRGIDNWHLIEDFAALISNRDEIWYATCLDICKYILAIRAQQFSADGNFIFNPTILPVWCSTAKGTIKAVPGVKTYIGND